MSNRPLDNLFLCLNKTPSTTPGIVSAIFKKDAIWPSFSTINIAFVNGEEWQKAWVRKIVTETFADIINLTLNFIPSGVGDINVKFVQEIVAWSYIGTESKYYNPSMNLGWLNAPAPGQTFQWEGKIYTIPPAANAYIAKTSDGSGGVVKHEFGHALGMVHEHQNPRGKKIEWNEQAVIEEVHRTNGWSEDQIRQQILTGFPVDQSNGSDFDKCSIMIYPFEGWQTLNYPEGIKRTTQLSKMDILWLSFNYPKNKPVVCRSNRCMYVEPDKVTLTDTKFDTMDKCLLACGSNDQNCMYQSGTSGSGLDGTDKAPIIDSDKLKIIGIILLVIFLVGLFLWYMYSGSSTT
jgi:hypothetical protein